MNDVDRNSEDDEEFVFETSEKPDLSEYDGLESFEFENNLKKLDLSEYDGLESFEFKINPEKLNLSENIGLESNLIRKNKKESKELIRRTTKIENKELISSNKNIIPKEVDVFMNNEMESIGNRNSKKSIIIIGRHKKFLDYIKTRYLNEKWTLNIPEEKIKELLKNFGILKNPTAEFYKKIIKFAPILISDNVSKNKAEVARKTGIDSDFPIIKYILPYLNPRFAKKTERPLSEKTIKERAREMNLKLLSDYEKEYKNQNSILQWMCLKCYYSFPESLANLQQYIIPCSNCRDSLGKDSRGIIRHKIPEYLKKRIFMLVRTEVDKFKRGESYMSLQKIQETILKEFPKDYISVDSVRTFARDSAKIRDVETGEIINYYDLMWSKVSKYTYDDAAELARKKGIEENNVPGSLITTRDEFNELIKNESPSRILLTWSCNIEGHPYWDARIDTINSQHSWCPKCFGERVGQSYCDFVELARRRGIEENNIPGSLVTTREEFNEMINEKHSPPSKVVLTWICNTKKHRPWDAIPNSIVQGTWCPYCSEGKYESLYRENIEAVFNTPFSKVQLHTLGTVSDKRIHFDCYSKISVIKNELILGNNKVKLILNEGLLILLNANQQKLLYQQHHKTYLINDFNNRKRVLKNITNDFLSNRIFINEGDTVLIEFPYGYLEFEFIDNVITLKSKVLKRVANSINLSLSGLKIASEYNGPQHYYFPNPFHRIYNNIRKDFATFMRFINGRCIDLFRKYFCNKHDIVLIEFPFWIDHRMNNPQVIQDYIIKAFQAKTGINIF